MNETAIGFRVSPNEVFFAIILNESKEYEFKSISSLKIPVSIDAPSKLRFIRNTIATIINQYNISYAGIKLIEGNARSSINNNMIFRFNAEGVLMELFSNSSVKDYFLGMTSNIASVLKIKKTQVEEMLDEFIDTTDLTTDNSKAISSKHKEAILVALAALEAGVANE